LIYNSQEFYTTYCYHYNGIVHLLLSINKNNL
jgi:hypothetical protein